jgi:hypothetical protein
MPLDEVMLSLYVVVNIFTIDVGKFFHQPKAFPCNKKDITFRALYVDFITWIVSILFVVQFYYYIDQI